MLPRPLTCAAVLVILSGALPGPAASRSKRDTEEQLVARIQKERNPVKKAKYEMRLGRLKLNQAVEGYDQGNLEHGAQLLGLYLEQMKSSWQTLHSSGRNAARQPQGFKELEFTLREDGRTLEDLAHRVSYFDRGTIEKAAKEIEAIRAEVLRALFPATHSPSSGASFLHLAASGALG